MVDVIIIIFLVLILVSVWAASSMVRPAFDKAESRKTLETLSEIIQSCEKLNIDQLKRTIQLDQENKFLKKRIKRLKKQRFKRKT